MCAREVHVVRCKRHRNSAWPLHNYIYTSGTYLNMCRVARTCRALTSAATEPESKLDDHDSLHTNICPQRRHASSSCYHRDRCCESIPLRPVLTYIYTPFEDGPTPFDIMMHCRTEALDAPFAKPFWHGRTWGLSSCSRHLARARTSH